MKTIAFLFFVSNFLAILGCSEEPVTSYFVEPQNPHLNNASSEIPIEQICSPEVQSLIDQMIEIASGERNDTKKQVMVGLSAPQIGIYKRIILIDLGVNTDNPIMLGQLKAYINPEIIWRSEKITEGRESCFSVDTHLAGIVPRAESIKVKAYDREGQVTIEEFSGLIARIFQHEIDHLDGIRFPDRIGVNGTLHWVEEKQYPEYRVRWEQWPVKCPWPVWISMKEGKAYQSPLDDSEPLEEDSFR